MNEEDEDKDGTFMFVVIITVAMLAGSFVLMTYLDFMQDEQEIKRLRDEISQKHDVSNDYIEGWNDCISKLIAIRNEATNVTSNVANNLTC